MSALPQTRLIRYSLLLRSDEALQLASDLRMLAAIAISRAPADKQITAQAKVMQSVAEQLEKQIV